MGFRPDRLPPAAVRVMNSARNLGSTEKLAWGEIFHLDRGPEGCYERPDRFAARLGRSRDVIEGVRRRLLRLGLVHREERRGQYCDSWFPVLPADCVPTARASSEEILRLAERLDEHIAATDETGQPDRKVTARIEPDLAVKTPPEPPQPGGDLAEIRANLAASLTDPGGKVTADYKGSSVLEAGQITSSTETKKDGSVPTPQPRTERCLTAEERVVMMKFEKRRAELRSA